MCEKYLTVPNRKMEAAIREDVEDFIKSPLMKGFGPTLMAEKLEVIKGIRLSKEPGAEVDAEVREVLARCQDEAVELLKGHEAALDRIATALLEKENIAARNSWRC